MITDKEWLAKAIQVAYAQGRYVYLYRRNNVGNRMIYMNSGAWVVQWVCNASEIRLYSTVGMAIKMAQKLAEYNDDVMVAELSYRLVEAA